MGKKAKKDSVVKDIFMIEVKGSGCNLGAKDRDFFLFHLETVMRHSLH
jgi:hypothetical protein